MSALQDIYKKNKNLHHAYLLEGEKEIIFPDLLLFLRQELNFATTGNPDFWVGDFDTLKIEDSHSIKEFQSKKALVSERKVLVIQTNFITVEAQNSLLKVFEEPTAETIFFLIMPSAEILLPTLKSRLTLIKYFKFGTPTTKSGKLSAGEFLGANIAQRFKLIKVFLPKKTTDTADKAGAIVFLNELEKALHQNYQKKSGQTEKGADASRPPLNPSLVSSFEEIIKCRSFLSDRSPSVKMILEHLSQIIPLSQ